MRLPKVLSEKTKCKTGYLKIISTNIKLPNKRIVNWNTIVWNHDSVAVVAIDDKNNIYFSREWRSAWKKKITILPAGGVKLNATERERIKQARNELREEIGFDAKKIEKIATILHAAKIKHKIFIYLATGLFKSPKKSDPEEIIEVVKMPFKKAYKMFLTGKKETTGYTLLGMTLAKEKLKIK